MLINFPNPRSYEFPEWVLIGEYFYFAKDIIYFGGDLIPENLHNAYRQGIFPWTIQGLPLPWFCPEVRAVVDFDRVHVPKSLAKVRKSTAFTFSIDRDFSQVISICSNIKRNGEKGTWITADFIEAYTELHKLGEAHSVEVWENDELIGGLYGVDAGGTFCGESMFHFRSNASKLALLHLIDHLKTRGATWLDAQVMTPHMENLGARDIPRSEFLDRLQQAQIGGLQLF